VNRLRVMLAAASVAVIASGGLTTLGGAGQSADKRTKPESASSESEIHVLPVRGNVYMLVGAGANITASVGKDGVLLVDTGTESMADKVIAVLNELAARVNSSSAPAKPCAGAGCAGLTAPSFLATIASPAPPKPISYVINTHMHPDHTGGNGKIAEAGRLFGGGPGLGGALARENAMIIAHENVLLGLSAASRKSKGEGGSLFAPSAGGLPTETFHGQEFRMNFFNGEGVVMYHQPAAHTDGDSLVFFRGSDVISAGDIFVMTSYPAIDFEHGGSIQGIIDGLNRILELAVPEYQTEGGTMIVPGHGRLADSADVAYYRDMVTIIRDRVRVAIGEGKTLEQVKAARLSKDYDPRFGRNQSWTGAMFVEAIYRSLGKNGGK
jgi:cyclase